MKKPSRTAKARKLTANEQILNRLAELGERMREIEDDIERIQGHLGRLAVHQGAVTALVPKLHNVLAPQTRPANWQGEWYSPKLWSGPDSN